MRRIILAAMMLVAAFSLLVAVPVQTALADAAVPFYDSGCETEEAGGNVYEVCFEDRGVEQHQDLPSGGEKITFNAASRWTLTVNGVLTGAGEDKVHAVFLFKASDVEQVNKQRASGFYSFPDMPTGGLGTCTYMYNFLYTAGVLRHYTQSFECDV